MQTCQAIAAKRDPLAQGIVARQYASQPELALRLGDSGREKCAADVKRHLDNLSQAIAVGRPALFVDYVAWAKVVLHARNIQAEDLAANLEACYQELAELPPNDAVLAQKYVLDGLSCLPSLPQVTPTFLSAERPLAELARHYLDALLESDRRQASKLIMDAVQQGTSIRDLYLHVFQRGQYEVGRLWQMNQISVGQEHLCTAATQLIMSQLYPLVFGAARRGRCVVAASVGGNLHEIGVRMVADFFEMDGWDTYYLGADVPTQSLVQAVLEHKADILALSATLLSHISSVTNVINAVRANRDCNVRILVGGHPFNVEPDLWRDVGADGYAADAVRTIDLADHLLQMEAV